MELAPSQLPRLLLRPAPQGTCRARATGPISQGAVGNKGPAAAEEACAAGPRRAGETRRATVVARWAQGAGSLQEMPPLRCQPPALSKAGRQGPHQEAQKGPHVREHLVLSHLPPSTAPLPGTRSPHLAPSPGGAQSLNAPNYSISRVFCLLAFFLFTFMSFCSLTNHTRGSLSF